MTDVLQCPYCALRFSTRSELEQHKALDHPQAGEDEGPVPAEPERETTQPKGTAEEPERSPEKRGFLSRLFKGK
jgi:hypothetical protein